MSTKRLPLSTINNQKIITSKLTLQSPSRPKNKSTVTKVSINLAKPSIKSLSQKSASNSATKIKQQDNQRSLSSYKVKVQPVQVQKTVENTKILADFDNEFNDVEITKDFLKNNTPYDYPVDVLKSINISQIIIDEIHEQRKNLLLKIGNYVRTKKKIPETTPEFYRILHVIGRGAFAKVLLGVQILSGKLVAIKLIDKSLLKSSSSKKRVVQEVKILKQLQNQEHIIRLLEVFENRRMIFIIQEYVDGSDLMKYIEKKKSLSESETRILAKQIIDGMANIQKNNVLHRDIKLDNILLDELKQIKIIDFGISSFVQKGVKMLEQCGTPAYLAPEIIVNKGYEGFASDVWSLGVMIFMMLTGKVPFKGTNIQDLNKSILLGIYDQSDLYNLKISSTALDLIRKILVLQPSKRLTICQIQQHSWFKDMLKQKQYENMGHTNIDMTILKTIESWGFPQDYILRCIQRKCLNHVTSLYFTMTSN